MCLHVVVALALALAVASPLALGAGGGSHGSYSTGTHGKATPGVARDSHGHIKRSEQAKDQFKKSHPCPSTGNSSGACPGYVIDHILPLKRGGADAPSNMQWQTEAAARQKDRWE
jgi:hypothetical protein